MDCCSTLAYTYSHSIDEGSTWHSGATTASGGAGGDGYSTDQSIPGFDRGNSVFDIRQRLGPQLRLSIARQESARIDGCSLRRLAVQWDLGFPDRSPLVSLHFSQPQTPRDYQIRQLDSSSCTATRVSIASGTAQNIGGDFNLDGGKNDRPNSSIAQFGNDSRKTWAKGWCPGCAPQVRTHGSGCGSDRDPGRNLPVHFRTVPGMRRHLGPEPVPRAWSVVCRHDPGKDFQLHRASPH